MNTSSQDDLAYGLQHIARHNAGLEPSFDELEPTSFNDHSNDGLQLGFVTFPGSGIQASKPDHVSYEYPDPEQFDESSPARSQSTTNENVRRTRSGRVVRRSDSPLSSVRESSSRVSKSPRPPKKSRSKKGNQASSMRLRGPLSELTKDSKIPVRDIEAFVNRPTEERIVEQMKRKGRIARPMNSFMLYRSAYAERTKDWCKQNNHQVVSSVAGESWPMESDELREQFNEWARIERDNHAKAFPDYKFSPSKAGARKNQDDEDDNIDYDGPDAEYRPSGRPLPMQRFEVPVPTLHSSSPYMTEPYGYPQGNEIYPAPNHWMPQYQPRPSSAPRMGMAPYPGQYYHHVAVQPTPYHTQMEEPRMRPSDSPMTIYGAAPVGLPAHQTYEPQDWRSSTPMSFQQMPSGSSSMYSKPAMYHDQGVIHPDLAYETQPTQSQFDEAYAPYNESSNFDFGDTQWPGGAVDPSLMNGSDNGHLYHGP